MVFIPHLSSAYDLSIEWSSELWDDCYFFGEIYMVDWTYVCYQQTKIFTENSQETHPIKILEDGCMCFINCCIQ